MVEFNASDARSRRSVEAMEFGSCRFGGEGFGVGRSVVVMDEVDGMSAGDRGGIRSIIEQIKRTKVPIICICNDRGH